MMFGRITCEMRKMCAKIFIFKHDSYSSKRNVYSPVYGMRWSFNCSLNGIDVLPLFVTKRTIFNKHLHSMQNAIYALLHKCTHFTDETNVIIFYVGALCGAHASDSDKM